MTGRAAKIPPEVHASADFSSCRTDRYRLLRCWGQATGDIGHPDARRDWVLWVMLNPSTADESELDPTLRRCRGYSLAWGFRSMSVCNLYAFRSTDPKGLRGVEDPVGPRCDDFIAREATRCSEIVVGWGRNADPKRALDVCRLVSEASRVPIRCLGENADGSPVHPLYQPRTATLRPYAWNALATTEESEITLGDLSEAQRALVASAGTRVVPRGAGQAKTARILVRHRVLLAVRHGSYSRTELGERLRDEALREGGGTHG